MEQPASQDPVPAPGLRLQLRLSDLWFLAIAGVIVALDQLAKWIVRANIDKGDEWPGDWVVHLVHVTNSGAAFGLFQGAGPMLIVTGLIGAGAIALFMFNPTFDHPLVRLGLAFMLGGAIGNLIDRFAAGKVVDFVKFPNWPAFNVADSAITIGVVLLIWTILFEIEDPETTESSP